MPSWDKAVFLMDAIAILYTILKKLFESIPGIFLFVLCGIIPMQILNGQENKNIAGYYALFDQTIGVTNSGIFNGVLYVEKHPVRGEDHKFFGSKSFMPGSVDYNEQSYFNVELKYDVYDDQLLIRNSEISGSPIAILDKEYIATFKINGHIFKNISFSTGKSNELSGFFEVLIDNDSLTLLKKHKKKIFRMLEDETDGVDLYGSKLYYKFKDQYFYYLYFNRYYYPLKKAGSLNAIFPQYKTQLKEIYKRHGALRKTDSESYLIAVIKDLSDTLIRNNNSM